MIQSLLIHDSIIMIQCGAAPPQPAYQKRGTRRDPNPRRPRNTGKAAGSNWRVARRRPLSKSGEENAQRLRAPPNCKAATRAESEKSEKARRVPVSPTAQPTIIGCAGGPAALPETDRRSPARKARKILQTHIHAHQHRMGTEGVAAPHPTRFAASGRGRIIEGRTRRPRGNPRRARPRRLFALPTARPHARSQSRKTNQPPHAGWVREPKPYESDAHSACEKNTRRKRCWKRRPKG